MTSARSDETGVVRHLTATGFLVWEGRVLLHWHRKNRRWLPMGGHIEPNEDPVQCVLREVEEESGVAAELFGVPPPYPFAQPQLAPPVTILLEQVTDGRLRHEHIDLIYFCRPRHGPPPDTFADPTMRWLGAAELEANAALSPFPNAEPAFISDDVRVLALEAIRRAGDRTRCR